LHQGNLAQNERPCLRDFGVSRLGNEIVLLKSTENYTIPVIQPGKSIHAVIQGLIASPFDPNEGTCLKFVPSTQCNGLKFVKIDKDDVSAEIAYWQSTILYIVLGANPPLEVMEGFVKGI